jgi:hypothetical protein
MISCMTIDIETALARLPRTADMNFSARDLPRNGIYLFYERGEGERIVRVGTHRGNGRLYDRLRDHYGTRRSHRAWRRTSDFRLLLGAALLNRDQDPRLSAWLDRKGERMREVEAQVTELLHTYFTFRTLSVDDLDERLALERALIGALSANPRMSEEWLGHDSTDPRVRASGLWNSEYAGTTEPLDAARLHELIEQTLALPQRLHGADERDRPEPEQHEP